MATRWVCVYFREKVERESSVPFHLHAPKQQNDNELVNVT